MDIRCYKCQTVLDLTTESKVSRQEECPKCFANIHCCKMCFFYEPKSYNECKEPVAQRIVEKEKNNFCEFFKLATTSGHIENKSSLQSAADALFKK